MRSLELTVNITPEGDIHLPAEIAAQLPKDHPVKAIFVLEDQEGDPWNLHVAENFLEGYAEEDSIYDKA